MLIQTLGKPMACTISFHWVVPFLLTVGQDHPWSPLDVHIMFKDSRICFISWLITCFLFKLSENQVAPIVQWFLILIFSLNWIHWSQTAPFFTQSSWLQVLLVSGEESSEANLKSTAAALGRGYVLSQVGADSDGKHKGWYIAKIDKYYRYPP